MARFKVENRLLIHRAKVKRRDFGAFLNSGRELERTPTTPAARRGRFLIVDGRFSPDQNIGQLVVSRPPGAQHFRGSDVAAQHFFDGAQQALANNRVVLRQDLQRHVLVDDLGHQITQLVELVNVSRIHQYTSGQRTRLVTAGLVGLIKQRPDLWVLREHHAVEVCNQRFPAAFQQRHSGFDDGTILSGKHKGDS